MGLVGWAAVTITSIQVALASVHQVHIRCVHGSPCLEATHRDLCTWRWPCHHPYCGCAPVLLRVLTLCWWMLCSVSWRAVGWICPPASGGDLPPGRPQGVQAGLAADQVEPGPPCYQLVFISDREVGYVQWAAVSAGCPIQVRTVARICAVRLSHSSIVCSGAWPRNRCKIRLGGRSRAASLPLGLPGDLAGAGFSRSPVLQGWLSYVGARAQRAGCLAPAPLHHPLPEPRSVCTHWVVALGVGRRAAATSLEHAARPVP